MIVIMPVTVMILQNSNTYTTDNNNEQTLSNLLHIICRK